MTVKQLIKTLKALPNQDAAIFMSSDGEGNEFATVAEVGGTDDEPIIWPGRSVELEGGDDEDDDS